MSFLNDLKKQAEQLKADQGVNQAELQANIEATELACQATFKYWLDLSKQLNVLQPVSKGRYVLDKQTVFEGLRFSNFRPDIRMRSLHGRDVTDHVALNCDLHTHQRMLMTKDFVAEMERLESRLSQAGIHCIPEPIRNPDNGKLIEVRYDFVANLQAGVRLLPDHEHGMVQFIVDNIDGLVRWTIQFQAAEVNTALLDELAKWLVGQSHQFTRLGKVLHLHEV